MCSGWCTTLNTGEVLCRFNMAAPVQHEQEQDVDGVQPETCGTVLYYRNMKHEATIEELSSRKFRVCIIRRSRAGVGTRCCFVQAQPRS